MTVELENHCVEEKQKKAKQKRDGRQQSSLSFQWLPDHEVFVFGGKLDKTQRNATSVKSKSKADAIKEGKIFEARTDGILKRTSSGNPLMLVETQAAPRCRARQPSRHIRAQEAAQHVAFVQGMELPRNGTPNTRYW